MNRTLSVSAVIITSNEEKHIARCLRSLTWADEIVIVDAASEDRTAEICKDPQAPWTGRLRFLTRAWTGFKDQRTFAMNEAKNNWLLVVDADEECSPELAAKITELMSAPDGPSHKAYKVKRVEYFLGKPIHYGIWNPSYQDRFFNRQGVKYVNDIHEYPIFPSPPQSLHEPLLHSPTFAPERFLEKMNKYTSIEARDRVKQGQRTNWFRMVFAFPAMFLKNYFYYSAYKDGRHGFAISILEGISRAVRHVKIWQYTQELEAREKALKPRSTGVKG
ncbi:MAG: glycosyltransferase family 2 protein [Methylotenera sp.]|nr:glycosyltransferase family 2 protein [Oligoflexia bacterium]